MTVSVFFGKAVRRFFIALVFSGAPAFAQQDILNILVVKLNPENGAILSESDPLWEGISETFLLIEDRYLLLSDIDSLDIGGCRDVQGCRKNFTRELQIAAPPGWALVPGAANYQRHSGGTYFRNNPNGRPTMVAESEVMSATTTISSAWVTFGCERDGGFGGGGCDARASLSGIAVKLE